MRNKKQKFENLPHMLQIINKVEYGRYTEDTDCEKLFEIFEMVCETMENFDDNDLKSKFMKFIILDVENVSTDRQIMNSYKIDSKLFPAYISI